MIFRLHSTKEIDVPLLIEDLIRIYVFDKTKAKAIFSQGFKSLPEDVVIDVLETKLPYDVCGSIVIINTKNKR